MAGATTIQSNPAFLNARTGIYTAWPLRNFMDGDPPGPGAADYESFRVKQRILGANLSADIGLAGALNQAWIRGTTRDGMGLYRADNIDYTAPTANTYLAQLNTGLIFTAADATNPRIDQVFLRILDQQHDGGGSNLLQVQVVDGTPTGGATLDNRTGVGAVPANSILLADVLVGPVGTFPTVVTANIRDRRPRPLLGDTPTPQIAATPHLLDLVTFQPPPGAHLQFGAMVQQSSLDAFQGAALMYLPRRIKGATRIRLKYTPGSAPANTFYQIAIADASGRPIVASGASVASYAGAANTPTFVALTIAATDFEAGWYYVWVGNAAATAGTQTNTFGVTLSQGFTTVSGGVAHPNQGLFAVSGGQVLPATLLNMSDPYNSGIVTLLTVPIVALSVG